MCAILCECLSNIVDHSTTYETYVQYSVCERGAAAELPMASSIAAGRLARSQQRCQHDHIVLLLQAAPGHILPIVPLVARLHCRPCAVTAFIAPSAEAWVVRAVERAGASVRAYRETVIDEPLLVADPEHHRGRVASTEMRWLPALVDDLRALHPAPTALLYDTFMSIGAVAARIAGRIPSIGLTPHAGPGWLSPPSPTAAARVAEQLRRPAQWLQARYGLDLGTFGDLGTAQSWHGSSTGVSLVLTCEELFSPPRTTALGDQSAAADFVCVGSLAAAAAEGAGAAASGSATDAAPAQPDAAGGGGGTDAVLDMARAAHAGGSRVVVLALGTLLTGTFWSSPARMKARRRPPSDAAPDGDGKDGECRSDGAPTRTMAPHDDGETAIVAATGAQIARYIWSCAFHAMGGRPDRFVLIATGRRPPEEAFQGLPPLPPNFVAARWLPLTELLPLSDAFICHGGMGSVMEALASGCPLCVVPVFADQPSNAQAAARAGFGISFDDPLVSLSAAALGAAIDQLCDPRPANTYRAAARAVASRMESDGGAAKAIDVIFTAAAAAATTSSRLTNVADAAPVRPPLLSQPTAIPSAPVDAAGAAAAVAASDILRALGVAQLLVINLARRPDRREWMERQLRALPGALTVSSEVLVACDGAEGPAAAWWSGRPFHRAVAPESRRGVAGCYASWEAALGRALALGRFPCLVVEDDINLLAPCRRLINSERLPVPSDAEVVALANGPSLEARGLGGSSHDDAGATPLGGEAACGAAAVPPSAWLSRSTAAIRDHCHSTGAMLLPSAAGAARLRAFLTSRNHIYHVDRVMQRHFVEEAAGVVYHAIPSLYGWIESPSDVEGGQAAWVRPAHRVA